MAGKPARVDEVLKKKERGDLGREIWQEYITDEANEPDLDIEFEDVEEVIGDPGLPESRPETSQAGRNKGKKAPGTAAGADEHVMASAIQQLLISSQSKLQQHFSLNTSDRVLRKKKKKHDFRGPGRTKNQNQKYVHGPDGALVYSGKDLCDCLQGDCLGCYYPCPKCGSGKCGSECRINRKWYYEKVEVEGTNLTWRNEFVKKT